MSGTLPSIPGFTGTRLSSVHRTLVSRTHSGRVQTRKVGGHHWRLTARYPAMTRDQFAPIWSFLMEQEGRFGTFQVVPPDLVVPRGVATGIPNVAAPAASGTTVQTQGWTANVIGILKAGDVFKFAGHAKVYMVTADANTDATGAATLQFKPPLVQNVAGTESLVVIDVPFTMAMTGDVQEYATRAPLLYTYELDLIEAL